MEDIIYFELNNWWPGEDYPNEEPFCTWMGDDLHLSFENEELIKENKLCVVEDFIDMSVNFCITATKEWVEQYCPKLLTEYREFLRMPNEDGDVYGQFGNRFLEYKKSNIGVHFEGVQ